MGPFELGDELSQRSIALGASLGIDMAGIDARLTPDGEVYCFEVSQSPVYSYYEARTAQAMAAAVAEYLMGHGPCLTGSGKGDAQSFAICLIEQVT